jgi:hypothetical protein
MTREERDALPWATPEQVEEVAKLMMSWRPEQLDDLKQRMATLRAEGKCTPKK